MPWNGAGGFTRLYSWVADKAAGLNISSSRMDADSNDIAANGFGNCLTRDGQGPPTGNLPMANFRHTGVGNAVARNDYAALGQVEDGLINWVAAGGAADAITATYSPALTSLADGQLCFFRATAANATTTPTFSPNGLTARVITRAGGAALAAGDIPGALAEIALRYNLAATRWELLNPATLVPGANSITSAMLQAGAVTFGKFQNLQNFRLLGNFSGATGSPQEVTPGSGLQGSGQSLIATGQPIPSLFKNLSIKVASNTTVAVAADLVAMSDGAGNYRTAAIAATCDLGTNGAVNRLDTGTIAIDTWYYIWAISNGVTDGVLASTSSSAPTMPSGYTFKARIGAVRTIHASATLYGTWQLGRRAQYVVGLAQTTGFPEIARGPLGTYSTTSPTWSAVTLQGNSGQSSHVPLTASVVFLITIEIRNHELLGKELCQLAYLTFHELVCHGFQTGHRPNSEPNAHPTCHWSEGWMDSLACEMAITWVTGPATGGHPWLPFGGATASAYVQSRHETRYQPGQGLGAEDAKLRRAAREARRRLAVAFHRNGLAQSEDEGKRLARTFSIVANAYGECRQLKRLGERLQSLLLSQAREHRTGEVAMACLEFLESHDFSSLENDLVRYAAA